jgi:hypothetical protein
MAARDAARAAGRIPLLPDQFRRVELMVAAVARQLELHHARPVPFTAGKPEQTVAWDFDGVACRSLVDWLHNDGTTIDDLKTTGQSASTSAWERSLFRWGGDIQAWMHKRAVEQLTGRIDVRFRWVVIETFEPFALNVIEPSAGVLTLGMKKALYAREKWQRALEADEWPGYPPDVQTADYPPWEETSWLQKEESEGL